jgi:multidrug resistance efflux pump
MYNLHDRSVYRRIQQGKIEAEKVDGSWVIHIDDDISQDVSHDKNMTIVRLKSENIRLKEELDYLKQQLDDAKKERERSNSIIQQIQSDAEAAKQRSDTIIMQLTRQLEQQTLMLEDMRHRSIWRRLKEVFATQAV